MIATGSVRDLNEIARRHGLPSSYVALICRQHFRQEAGVWIFGGGVERQSATITAIDGTVSDGPFPEIKATIGGFVIIDVPSHTAALEWAAKFAVACRYAQEVRDVMFDPHA